MRIECPVCGARDSREFTCKGGAEYLDRPASAEWGPDWDAYLHLRENASGPGAELWQHGAGCGAWLVVERNRTTHAISAVRLAAGDRA